MGTVNSSLLSNAIATPVSTAASNSSSSSGAGSSSGSTSSAFTGSSSFSQDFANVISRAVSIASLPIGLLQNQQSALTNQSNELTTLDSKFTALQSAVQGIQDALNGSSFQADVSDPKSIGATLGDGATEGVYSINVSNIGAYASSLTSQSWDASSRTPNKYTVLIGTQEFTFIPADNSATTVASTIDSLYGSLVQATAVNVGSASSPSQRISLQSTQLGPMALDIQTVQAGSLQQQTAPTGDGYATSQTAKTWASTGGAGSYNLEVGGAYYHFSTVDDSAATVANAINNSSQLGSLVTASVVNLGSDSSPDYRIQLQSKQTGVTNLDLQQVTSLQTAQTAGQLASYSVDGGGAVQSNTRAITVSNGVTLNLLATTSGAVNVTVTRPTSTLLNALTKFTSAYNAAFDEINGQRGQSAGPLQGQPVLSSLSQALSNIATYTSTGSVNGLTALGVELGSDGHLTFTPTTLMATDFSNSAGVTAFLGSSTSGFLQAATAALDNLEKTGTGLIKMSESDLKAQIDNLGTRISDKQNQVAALQLQLQNQMAQSDALISSMEQKALYLSQMFDAQQTASKSYSG